MKLLKLSTSFALTSLLTFVATSTGQEALRPPGGPEARSQQTPNSCTCEMKAGPPQALVMFSPIYVPPQSSPPLDSAVRLALSNNSRVLPRTGRRSKSPNSCAAGMQCISAHPERQTDSSLGRHDVFSRKRHCWVHRHTYGHAGNYFNDIYVSIRMDIQYYGVTRRHNRFALQATGRNLHIPDTARERNANRHYSAGLATCVGCYLGAADL